jgi:hypothetical protein
MGFVRSFVPADSAGGARDRSGGDGGLNLMSQSNFDETDDQENSNGGAIDIISSVPGLPRTKTRTSVQTVRNP